MSLPSYQSLSAIAGGQPIRTREVAARLRVSASSASRLLRTLAQRGLAIRVRPGLWIVGEDVPDPFVLAPSLTAPAPAYISFTSALGYRGIIDQLPRQVTVASTGRPRKIATDFGDYVVHRIPSELFGGWSGTGGAWVASPEKALFDIAYIAAVRGTQAFVPELELPDDFDRGILRQWLRRIPSARLRTRTTRELERLMARAVR